MRKLTTEEFIEKAKEVHGDQYDYSLTEYVNNKQKVKIICSKHGVFEQAPFNHKNGYSCAKCSYEKMAEKQRKSQDEFIQQCKKVHKNKYDYSKAEYKGYKSKIKITCPIHEEFMQEARYHVEGCGCPKSFVDEILHVHKINKSSICVSNLLKDNRTNFVV